MTKTTNTTRRTFIKKSAAVATAATLAMHVPVVKPVLGANDKIRVGFIGIGNRGTQVMEAFMKNEDVEVAALCDVYEPYLLRDNSRVEKRFIEEIGRIPKMDENFPSSVKRYKDFRKLLEQKDIDAVCIATPDHWHAIQTIAAVDAGKDVYVEKPLTITLHEGRKMIEAQKRTNQVVQVGLNRRGSTVYQKLAKEVKEGKIGKVTTARAYRVSNMFPDGIGKYKPEQPPKDFDWDMWIGPREFQPFQYNIAPYKFRWWKNYSTQMGNWGVHYMDVIRWIIGEEAPVAISASGGKYALKDDRTIPDTMEVTFEMPSGAIIIFGIYEASGGGVIPGGEVELRGTHGNLYTTDRGYKLLPTDGGQFQNREGLIKEEDFRLPEREDITYNLVRNFLDCVKSRKTPWCPLEDGHRSTSFAHLANISLEVGMKIEWDAKKEKITNNSMANDLLHYEYRKPWKLG